MCKYLFVRISWYPTVLRVVYVLRRGVVYVLVCIGERIRRGTTILSIQARKWTIQGEARVQYGLIRTGIFVANSFMTNRGEPTVFYQAC
jgi:hypothetical protein